MTSLLLLTTVLLFVAADSSALVVAIRKVFGIGLASVLQDYHLLSAVSPIQCVAAKRVGSVHGEPDAVVVVEVLQMFIWGLFLPPSERPKSVKILGV